jgi:long-chain acyl-CoA synthetase
MMVYIDFLRAKFAADSQKDAIAWRGAIYDYGYLLSRIEHWQGKLTVEGVRASNVVVLQADFSPEAVALFLALVDLGCVLVPLTSAVKHKQAEFVEIAQGEWVISVDPSDAVTLHRLENRADHEIYKTLKRLKHPGLVLFSSGSTGNPKAAVHDFCPLLEKFKIPRHSLRTMPFLLYDHIGGINTMLYSLSNTGMLVTVQDRRPDSVLEIVERYKVELLPTSPTFINLVLLSEAYKRHDLSSLKLVTYGTETMPETTLKRFHQLFPAIRLLQTYGLSELGIMRSKSRDSDSLWMKIGGEGFETRVVDGILHIKAHSTMLGYLNAPAPFTQDGWFNTGDAVEIEGEYIKVLGRTSEIINVGGEKVFPAEVENVIQQIDNVADVTVYGEQNSIIGNVVCAKIRLKEPEDKSRFIARMKTHCGGRLAKYKVPVKVVLDETKQHGDRFKKIRTAHPIDN